MFKVKGKEYPCCMSVTMGMVGGKWKTVILYHLMENEKLRYNELSKKMATVTERTLSLQLKQLQQDGMINRKVYTSTPPLKVEYTLTKLGKTLIPLLKSIEAWGNYAISNLSD
ncbi:MAG: winged helix-turn-helix transcriptional regulator [Saprospiraceae bacterium]